MGATHSSRADRSSNRGGPPALTPAVVPRSPSSAAATSASAAVIDAARVRRPTTKPSARGASVSSGTQSSDCVSGSSRRNPGGMMPTTV